MKATGIVRRVDDLGRVVIPKEIRRTMRIREGDPLLTTLTPFDKFYWAIHSVVKDIINSKTEQKFCSVLSLFVFKFCPTAPTTNPITWLFEITL